MLFHLSEYLLTVTDGCAPAIMITDHHSYFDAEDDCSNSYYSQFHVDNRSFVDAGSQIEGQAVILCHSSVVPKTLTSGSCEYLFKNSLWCS